MHVAGKVLDQDSDAVVFVAENGKERFVWYLSNGLIGEMFETPGLSKDELDVCLVFHNRSLRRLTLI